MLDPAVNIGPDDGCLVRNSEQLEMPMNVSTQSEVSSTKDTESSTPAEGLQADNAGASKDIVKGPVRDGVAEDVEQRLANS